MTTPVIVVPSLRRPCFTKGLLCFDFDEPPVFEMWDAALRAILLPWSELCGIGEVLAQTHPR